MWKYNVLIVCIAMCVFGCRSQPEDLPDLGKVSGTVTIDGNKLPNVVVTFAPQAGGRSSSGVTDSNGFYSLGFSAEAQGAMVGNHKVFVSSKVDYDPNDPDGPMVPPAGNVPSDYANIIKEASVSAGSNTIDLAYP